jgi:C4-dicarboxylate transporter, DctM subunit
MEPSSIALLSIPGLLAVLAMGLHVGIALGLMGLLGLFLITGSIHTALSILTTTPYAVTADFALAVLPLFILMGSFAGAGGLAEGAYNAAQKWLGRMPGGLAMATVVSNAIFGAACGSSAAACAVFTKFSVPQMHKYNYQREFACGTVAAAGVLTMLIPPSVLMVVYGILTGVSIGALFMAGIMPGILLAFIYSIGIFIWVKLKPEIIGGDATTKRVGWGERIIALKDVWGIVLLMLIVMGGIYGGLFTPTEAGAAGAFGAFILALAQGKLNKDNTWEILQEAGKITAMIFLLFIGAQIYSRFMSFSGLPGHVIEWVQALHLPSIVILSTLVFIYLILGCLIDSISMMVLTLPIAFPISQALGWHPLWFAMVVIMSIEIGLLTPPVGINVYVVSAAAGPDVSVESVFKASVPYFFMMVFALILLMLFPCISTFLPGLMK